MTTIPKSHKKAEMNFGSNNMSHKRLCLFIVSDRKTYRITLDKNQSIA